MPTFYHKQQSTAQTAKMLTHSLTAI